MLPVKEGIQKGSLIVIFGTFHSTVFFPPYFSSSLIRVRPLCCAPTAWKGSRPSLWEPLGVSAAPDFSWFLSAVTSQGLSRGRP